MKPMEFSGDPRATSEHLLYPEIGGAIILSHSHFKENGGFNWPFFGLALLVSKKYMDITGYNQPESLKIYSKTWIFPSQTWDFLYFSSRVGWDWNFKMWANSEYGVVFYSFNNTRLGPLAKYGTSTKMGVAKYRAPNWTTKNMKNWMPVKKHVFV